MDLSTHLTLDEFCDSNYAKTHGIDNRLPDELLEVAKYTATKLFEPIRSLLGDKPIPITSGYRCPELNKAVGGQPSSQHMKAQALDLVPTHISVRDAFEMIKSSSVVFDQMIVEHNKAGSVWLHVSLANPGDNRRQCIPYLMKK